MTQNIIVTVIALAAAAVIVWQMRRANRAANAETPSCPSCPGYDPALHGPARPKARARS